MRRRIKLKYKKNWLLIIIILVVTVLGNYYYITKKLSEYAIHIYEFNIDRLINKNILNYYDNDVSINDLIKINYMNNEVNSISYDIEKTNTFMRNKLAGIGDFFSYQESLNISIKDDSFITSVPIGMLFNNVYFNNWGIKVPVRIEFIDNYLVNVKTVVSNYGINNILVELYLELFIDIKMMIQEEHVVSKQYNYLIASVIMNGNVPSIYQDKMEVSSPSLNIQR